VSKSLAESFCARGCGNIDDPDFYLANRVIILERFWFLCHKVKNKQPKIIKIQLRRYLKFAIRL
jgi:hypothetical protein